MKEKEIKMKEEKVEVFVQRLVNRIKKEKEQKRGKYRRTKKIVKKSISCVLPSNIFFLFHQLVADRQRVI